MSSISNTNLGFGGISGGTGGSTGGPRLGTTLFGVDIDQLVDNLVNARGLANQRREVQIDANTSKLSAYSSLNSLLSSVKVAASALRNPVVSTGTADIFDARQVLSTASGSIPANSLFGASTSDNATLGTYSLTINRTARSDTVTSTVTLADADTTSATTGGALTINGKDITLTSGMNLNQIRNAINDKIGETEVRASVVKVNDTTYRLVLKSTVTGEAMTFADNVGGTLLTELGITASGLSNQDLSAELVLDGTTVYRQDNSVGDLIPGVNLELFQADPGKPVTVNVDNNLTAMSNTVGAFIDAYNTLVDFVAAQRAVGENGEVSEEQLLFNDSFMISTYRSMQSYLSEGALGVGSGDLKLLRDIGIEIGSDNRLVVTDTNKLEDALIDRLDEVKALFGFAGGESQGITVVSRPGVIGPDVLAKTITVNIASTDGQGRPTAASFVMDGITIAATINNGFIEGAEGTILEGFTVGYDGGVLASGQTYTGTFTPTQGIADRIGALLDDALDPLEGGLKTVTDQVRENSDRLNSQIVELNLQLDLYRNRLLSQFQAAQAAISILESFQNSIQNQVESWNSGG